MVRGLALATHLGPTLSVTAITTLLALELQLGTRALLVGGVALLGQCSVGWSNDALDLDRDVVAGRMGKPIVAGLVSRRAVGALSVLALVSSVLLSAGLGGDALLINAAALAGAWAYNLGLKSTWLSPLPYLISFGLLPAFVTQSQLSPAWPRPAAMVAAGLLGVGAHLINTLKDAEADALTGVRGLPQRIGPTASLQAGVGLLAAALVAVLVLERQQLSALRWLLAGAGALAITMVVVESRRGRASRSWTWTLLAALATVALFCLSGSSLTGA
jgi:4-hydroxybenzoate polyprenyltransferase